MCGLAGIINFKSATGKDLYAINAPIRHRGPDDEGYLTWDALGEPAIWAGQDTAGSSLELHQLQRLPMEQALRVGLAHRRLSILDLSAAGHQPMVSKTAGLAIVFNGEIYNYLEVREELQQQGFEFHTHSDTEVILQAWACWGAEALHRFNGMFAFLLLDFKKQQLVAVRDRFGVKPLYFTRTSSYLAFASEVKQLRGLGEYKFELNTPIAYDYLKHGYIDHEPDTFELGLQQIMPGQLMAIDLKTNDIAVKQWYTLQPKAWRGSAEEALQQFKNLLHDAVRLRMRSDVPVGSALSGGLDSSTIVCLMRQVLDEAGNHQKVLETVTSACHDKRFDETAYAELVNKQTKSISHKVYPDFDKLQADYDRLLWHMDYPFGSTSQFSQWSVFERAHQAGLTVMIDGQGADEQLAGYGGNDLALYAGLLASGSWGSLMAEAKSYKIKYGSWPKGFLLGAVAQWLPASVQQQLPASFQVEQPSSTQWLQKANFKSRVISNSSLRQHLLGQVSVAPLPALLRYEDRNSMAFSVESRTPFMDYRILEFTLGLPERLVYRNNERKYILRQAFKGIVPNEILERKDKMGFVTAEERWLKEEGRQWFEQKVNNGALTLGSMVNATEVSSMMAAMQAGKRVFNFDPWRILCLADWLTKHQ
jgi:asparagine synthase (glutamine-hydrolysing)